MTETVCYKIRDRNTGLWSAGGTEPRFNKIGKSWSKGPLLNHLAQFKIRNGSFREVKCGIPDNWEVVKFVISQSETDSVVGAREMYESRKVKK